MNSRFFLLAIIGLALLGAVALFLGSNATNNTQPSPVNTDQPIGAGPGISLPSGMKEFTIKGIAVEDPATGTVSPRFDTQEIRVKKGDRVRIAFENISGFHDWGIDEFNARTKQIEAGQTDVVEFTTDKAGTFEYYCSTQGHREMGMTGKLIVEE